MQYADGSVLVQLSAKSRVTYRALVGVGLHPEWRTALWEATPNAPSGLLWYARDFKFHVKRFRWAKRHPWEAESKPLSLCVENVEPIPTDCWNTRR